MNFISAFALSHLRAALASLGRCVRSPISTALTVLVITLALALPTGLLVLLQNVKGVTHGLERQSQITLFLKQHLNQESIDNLIARIRLRPDVSHVEYISPDDGLKHFQNISGFGNVLNHLPDNPLPPVIEVYPLRGVMAPQVLQSLTNNLQQLSGVETAKLDMQWVMRLFSIIKLGQRTIFSLLLLFSLAVLLILGNTIRLATQNQREEIEIIKLVGGTNAFIRRPFLYTGIWYGLAAGCLAWLLIASLMWWLSSPTNDLMQLYDSRFHLLSLTPRSGVTLLVISTLLGLLGAWLAVSRQLRSFEPH